MKSHFRVPNSFYDPKRTLCFPKEQFIRLAAVINPLSRYIKIVPPRTRSMQSILILVKVLFRTSSVIFRNEVLFDAIL